MNESYEPSCLTFGLFIELDVMDESLVLWSVSISLPYADTQWCSLGTFTVTKQYLAYSNYCWQPHMKGGATKHNLFSL